MTKNRRRWLLICALVGVPIGCCLGCLLWSDPPWNPARQSDEAIRDEILDATPLGSSKQQVEEYATSRFKGRFYYTAPGPRGEAKSIWLTDGDAKEYLKVSYGSYPTFASTPTEGVRSLGVFRQGYTFTSVGWKD